MDKMGPSLGIFFTSFASCLLMGIVFGVCKLMWSRPRILVSKNSFCCQLAQIIKSNHVNTQIAGNYAKKRIKERLGVTGRAPI